MTADGRRRSALCSGKARRFARTHAIQTISRGSARDLLERVRSWLLGQGSAQIAASSLPVNQQKRCYLQGKYDLDGSLVSLMHTSVTYDGLLAISENHATGATYLTTRPHTVIMQNTELSGRSVFDKSIIRENRG
jgi:hypothetical protein